MYKYIVMKPTQNKHKFIYQNVIYNQDGERIKCLTRKIWCVTQYTERKEKFVGVGTERSDTQGPLSSLQNYEEE